MKRQRKAFQEGRRDFLLAFVLSADFEMRAEREQENIRRAKRTERHTTRN